MQTRSSITQQPSALRRLGLLILPASFAWSCSPLTSPPEGMVERKPSSRVGAYEEVQITADQSKTLLGLKYRLELRTVSEATLCSGIFSAGLYGDFNLKFDDSQVGCGSFRIDINQLLGSINLMAQLDQAANPAASPDQDAAALPSLKHDGQILYLASLGDEISFEPPRPLIIGPLIFDHAKYRGLKKVVQTTVRINEADFVGSGVGTYTAEVLETDLKFSNDKIKSGLDSTIHWQVTSQGLQNLPDKHGMLIPKFEVWWNSAPIMVPRIKIQLSGKSLIAQADEDGTLQELDSLLGDLTIDINLEEYVLP